MDEEDLDRMAGPTGEGGPAGQAGAAAKAREPTPEAPLRAAAVSSPPACAARSCWWIRVAGQAARFARRMERTWRFGVW